MFDTKSSYFTSTPTGHKLNPSEEDFASVFSDGGFQQNSKFRPGDAILSKTIKTLQRFVASAKNDNDNITKI